MIIPVNLGSRSYRIIVESGALDTVGARLAELRVGSRTALVSDAAILRLYGKAVGRSLESAGFTVDRKSTRLNSSHLGISYAVFCLKKKNNDTTPSENWSARTTSPMAT